MAVQPARDESAHLGRQLGEDRGGLGFGRKFGEETCSGARHPRLRAPAPEPRKLRCHHRVASDDHGFEIVRSLPWEKGRYCQSFGLSCQRKREDFPRGNRDLRREDEVPGGGQFERAQALNPDDWNYHRQEWSFTPAEAGKKWLEKFQKTKEPYYPKLDLKPKGGDKPKG